MGDNSGEISKPTGYCGRPCTAGVCEAGCGNYPTYLHDVISRRRTSQAPATKVETESDDLAKLFAQLRDAGITPHF